MLLRTVLGGARYVLRSAIPVGYLHALTPQHHHPGKDRPRYAISVLRYPPSDAVRVRRRSRILGRVRGRRELVQRPHDGPDQLGLQDHTREVCSRRCSRDSPVDYSVQYEYGMIPRLRAPVMVFVCCR